MAIGYTPEEIIELKAREADEIKRLGQATVETRMALLDMSAGVKGLTATLTGGLGMLGTSALGLGKDLAAGKIGVSVFNKSIDGVSGALGNLLGLIPYIGPALKTLVKGVGDYSQAVNDQAELLYNNYQEMSKIGAAGAEGMQGVYDNLKRMNYGTEELDKFVSIVRENATTLANFGGTVGQGLNEIARVSASVQSSDIGRQFMDMGMSVDQINKGIAGFNKMQVLYGARQKMTSDEQTTAAANYIKQIDLLAKVTGKNAEQQMALEESALTQERYAGYRLKFKIKSDETADQATKEAIKTQLSTVDAIQKDFADAPEIRQGFLNILSKTLDNPEAAKFLQTYPEAAQVAAKEFFTAGEMQAAMSNDLLKNKKALAEMAALGINNITYAPINEQLTLEAKFMKGTLDERMKLADAEQKMTNKATQDYTDIQIANRKSRDVFQDLLNAGIPKITAAMKGAANATDAVTGAMEKIAEKMGITVKKREEPGASPTAEARPAAPRPVGSAQTLNEKIIQAESGGRNIPNQSGAGGVATSSAYGVAQITKGTFEGLAKNAQPGNALYGKTFDDMKKDVGLQREALSQLTDRNKATLESQRLSTSDAAVYLAHFLGAAGATKLLKLPDSAPLSAGVSADQIAANPMLQKMATVGDLKAWADKKMGGGGYAKIADTRWGEPKQATTPAGPAPAANGGIIRATPGGVNVLAAEAGKNEAFVPLPDGKTIPVQMVGNEQQMSMMAAQLDRLDQMVRIMQNQVGVSEQILKYAQ
jgi:hypothetical protein